MTAQDGVTKNTYYLIVNKQKSGPALSNLVISNGATLSPVFNSATTTYSTTVASTVTSVTITPTVANTGSTVTVNGLSVISGSASSPISLIINNNVISVVVANEAQQATYTINIVRISGTVPTLSSLAVSNGTLDPTFNPATTSYSLQVGYSVSQIQFTPATDSSSASIFVNGTKVTSGMQSGEINLSVGQTIVPIVCQILYRRFVALHGYNYPGEEF